MATGDAFTVCSIRSCSQAAVGEAARSSSLLCQSHLNQDFKRVRSLRESLTQKLKQELTQKVNLSGIRLHHGLLQQEIQLIEQHIDHLHHIIDKHHRIIKQNLERRSETLLKCLQHMTQLQQYEKDVLQAEHDEQMKKLFESLTHMETAMEEASEQFEMLGGVDSVSRVTQIDSQTRCLPDVSGGVKEMSFVIDRHMRRVAELTEAEHRVESWVRDGEGQVKAAAAAAAVCEQPTCVIDAGGEVECVTSCSRTDGFVGDKSGRVIKASLGDEDGVKLPNPCIFVAFWFMRRRIICL
jgi:chromosome segregation ATPase